MNEGGRRAWKRKDTSAQSRGWGWSGAAGGQRPSPAAGLQAAARSGPTGRPGHGPSASLPPAQDPPAPTSAAGAGPGGKPNPRRHPARPPGTAPRSAWRRQRPTGACPTRPAAPTASWGVEDEAEGGRRAGRRTQELPPPPPPALNLQSLASPSRRAPPSTPLASPPGPPRSKRVAGNASKRSRSRRGRSLMAWPVRCPVAVRESSRRLRRKWRYSSSGLRAGRGGARTTHGPSPRPFLWPGSAVHVAASRLPAAGCAGREAWESRGGSLGRGDSPERPPPPAVRGGHLRLVPRIGGLPGPAGPTPGAWRDKVGWFFFNIYF